MELFYGGSVFPKNKNQNYPSLIVINIFSISFLNQIYPNMKLSRTKYKVISNTYLDKKGR
jgi:hypothetical protein